MGGDSENRVANVSSADAASMTQICGLQRQFRRISFTQDNGVIMLLIMRGDINIRFSAAAAQNATAT